jgi:hypothetical protein
MLTSAIATWYMHQIIADQIYSLSTHLKKSACNKFKSVYIIITFSPIILSIRYRLPAYNSHTPYASARTVITTFPGFAEAQTVGKTTKLSVARREPQD